MGAGFSRPPVHKWFATANDAINIAQPLMGAGMKPAPIIF